MEPTATSPRRILVTGAAGGLGHNVVDHALARGLAVRALVRDPKRASFAPGVEVVAGDALDVASVTSALTGCDALFHMVNVTFGPAWIPTTAKMLDAALAACTQTGARLVFPANVWIFGRGTPGARLAEGHAVAPTSRKGAARAAKEARIRASGARFVMVRLPEFYGPHVGTLTGPPLMAIAHGKTGTWYGPADLDVELVFMPDAAEALLTIGLADGVDGEVFHLPGFAPITPRAYLARAVALAGGGGARHLPGLVVRAAGLFDDQAKEFADIFHLWTHPVILDGAKVAARFPSLPRTSYDDGIKATLAWLRANPTAHMHF